MAHQPGAVGAVGQANVYPNSRNVIPGRAVFTVDFRSPDLAKLTAMRMAFEAEAAEIAKDMGLGMTIEPTGHFDPVTFDPDLKVNVVRDAAERLGYSHGYRVGCRARRLLDQPRGADGDGDVPCVGGCHTTRRKRFPRNGRRRERMCCFMRCGSGGVVS